MSEVGKQRRIIGGFRIVVALLVVVIVALAIAFGVVVSRLHKQLSSVPGACPSSGNIDLEPPSDLPPFHDLTREEIKAVRNFLYRQKDLNLVRPSEITVNSSYVFSFELHIPNKQVTTDYLDNGRARPDREARVVVFRGDLPDPTSEEYTVGPLPDPVYFKDKVTLPFRYRPLTGPEIVAAIVMLNAEVGGKMNDILMECYGGRIEDCSDNCLEFQMVTPMASGSTGEEFRRKMWFWLGPTVEYFPLHALDFLVRVDLTSSKTSDYYIDQIYHANQSFYSVDELVRSYDAGDFVDMDINGRENRFETIEIVPTEVDNSQWSKEKDAKYSQTKIVRKTMGYEKTAVIDYKFSTPKYLTFYNKDTVNSLGVPKAYRLLMRGMSKQLIKEGSGQEPSIPWARHQLAVTKYKEDERKSSSIYACWDANHPVVNFQSFIDDNDVIKDVDQVTWVTMGVHHIPHTEDLPVTPTVGLDLRFLLLPFNYFQEDPAMGSGDAVRIEPNNQEHASQGLHVERYGRPENPQCRPAKSSRIIGGFRIVVALLLIVIVALAIAFGVVVSRLHKQLSSVPGACPSYGNIDLEPLSDLPPFQDLTRDEIKAVRNFLYRQKDLNLVRPSEITLHIPNKQVTTDYLDNGRARPDREARVVVFRGDLPDPTSEEYTVGPLPDPVYFKDKVTLPFRYRPLTGPEIVAAIVMLNAEVGGKMNDILMERYGGRIEGCSDNCLEFQMVTPRLQGQREKSLDERCGFGLGRLSNTFLCMPWTFLFESI
ncbi:AMO-like protein [Mya arenaria]|uniref:Amine oxidase n=1 Tax=Mya arenaria TaxID=6604 RepID=A0ABY7DSU9_MYAAR|nr:AMO-like protein [Mya arenaria]